MKKKSQMGSPDQRMAAASAKDSLKALYSAQLFHDIASDRALAWSGDHQLAVIVSKGVLVLDVHPNPLCRAPSLNLSPTYILADDNPNPSLSASGLGLGQSTVESLAQTQQPLEVALDPSLVFVGGADTDPVNSKTSRINMVQWTDAYPARENCLITLTMGGWLRLYSRTALDTREWKLVMDFSGFLNQHLKSHRVKWKASSVKGGSGVQGSLAKSVQERAHLIATSNFAQSSCFAEAGGYSYSYMVTAQRSKDLVLFLIKNPPKEQSLLTDGVGVHVTVVQIVRPKGLGIITSLNLKEDLGNNGNGIVAVGGLNGKVRLFQIVVDIRAADTAVQLNLVDVGLVWNEPDFLAVRQAMFVDCPESGPRRVILLKSSHCVVLDFDLDEDKVTVLGHRALSATTSGFVAIERTGRSQGDFYLMGRDSMVHLLTLDADLSNCHLEPELEEDPVSKANSNVVADRVFQTRTGCFQSCGMACSANGSIWVVAQDYQVEGNESRGRLTFLTSHTFEDLSQVLLGETGVPSIRSRKDTLEVFRVLASRTFFVPKTVGGGLGEEELEAMEENKRTVVNTLISLCQAAEGDVGVLDRRQFLLWLLHFFANLFEGEKTSGAQGGFHIDLDQLSDRIHSDILVSRAKTLLTKFFFVNTFVCKDHETFAAGLGRFVVEFSEASSKEKEPIPFKCRLCGSESVGVYSDAIKCSSGHVWPRCILTLSACDTPEILKCCWCESVAAFPLKLPDSLKQDLVYETCTICGGPLS